MRHHPADNILLAYVFGTLSEAFGLIVLTHVHQCQLCQETIAFAHEIAAAKIGEGKPVAMDPDSKGLVRSRLGLDPMPVPPVLTPEMPAPLDRVSMSRWWPVLPGWKIRYVRTKGEGCAVLIRGEAGLALPKHSHEHEEWGVVLSGHYRDGGCAAPYSEPYGPGDFINTESSHPQHPPTITDDGPCVSLVAANGIGIDWLDTARKLIRRRRA